MKDCRCNSLDVQEDGVTCKCPDCGRLFRVTPSGQWIEIEGD